MSSFNWSESLLKYSAFDFLISFITEFRLFLKFCHTCCTLVRFARLYRRLRLRISLRTRPLMHGYSFGLIVAIVWNRFFCCLDKNTSKFFHRLINIIFNFRPCFIGGSFRPDFWGESFGPDLFIWENR